MNTIIVTFYDYEKHEDDDDIRLSCYLAVKDSISSSIVKNIKAVEDYEKDGKHSYMYNIEDEDNFKKYETRAKELGLGVGKVKGPKGVMAIAIGPALKETLDEFTRNHYFEDE